jgi:hypothetical protein
MGGVLAGMSTEREVVKLFGNGVYLDTLGDTGSRFYSNRDRTMSVVVVFSTDRRVSNFTISLGFNPPHQLADKDFPSLITDFIDHHGLLENYLDEEAYEVIKWIGQPQKEIVDGSTTYWVYESICGCELRSWIQFKIIKNKIVSISVSHDFG